MTVQGAAELVGKKIGELCLAKNISTVSFDRGGNVYHGRVKVLDPPSFRSFAIYMHIWSQALDGESMPDSKICLDSC